MKLTLEALETRENPAGPVVFDPITPPPPPTTPPQPAPPPIPGTPSDNIPVPRW